ncbi:putative Carbohydrate-binding module family 18 protein [Seiridium cardinale]
MRLRHSFLSPTLLLSLLLRVACADTSNNTLSIYDSSALGNLTASEVCISALTSNVTCYAGLNRAVTQTTSWSSIALGKICTAECTSSLEDYVAAVDDACGSDTYNISGSVETASYAGQELIWKQTVTCLTDDSTGDYCNTEFQDSANGTGATGIGCSQCYLDYLYTIADSAYGQGVVNANYFETKASNCSATGYTMTYSATATSTSAAATEASNVRCNATDSSASLYEVQVGDSCLSISASQNVSTGALANTNALDLNCTYLTTGESLCLPEICEIYQVQENDTCNSVLESLERQVSVQTFISWNSNLNSQCSNIQSLSGTYVCISPPGTTTLPSSYSLRAATTAAAVPTNYVTSSNTECGYWYTILDDDTCTDVADTYGISLDNFYFLNPQLNGSCTSLWVGNAYCVEAVGNIKTYSGYTATSTRNYTTLENTVNTVATRTVNRTTTHFFYSWPTISTTSAPYNSTVYTILSTYTLCDDALDYYGIDEEDTDIDGLPDEAYENEEWMSEYDRVCMVNPDAALPTQAFNTSIVLSTDTATATEGATASVGTATLTGTASASATGLSVSPDGTCGSDAGYTCSGSSFGDCCSLYGYCGSSDDYCVTYCDSDFGLCDDTTSATATATATATPASTTSTPASSTSTSAATASTSTSTGTSVSTDGTCGGDGGYTCEGSSFGDCCSAYGYW